jgi:alkanesulfonate monooxygenase SsuD/methylene tetrahydromethanopterin reductase-like flavin-dependent oxidoreductase (luciferase family)
LMKAAGRPPNRSFTKDGRAINMMTGSVQDLIDAGIMFCGTPDQVYDQITGFAESCGGMGNLLSMSHAGFMDHDDTVANLSLFAKEVLPRLKEYRQPNEAAAAAE